MPAPGKSTSCRAGPPAWPRLVSARGRREAAGVWLERPSICVPCHQSLSVVGGCLAGIGLLTAAAGVSTARGTARGSSGARPGGGGLGNALALTPEPSAICQRGLGGVFSGSSVAFGRFRATSVSRSSSSASRTALASRRYSRLAGPTAESPLALAAWRTKVSMLCARSSVRIKRPAAGARFCGPSAVLGVELAALSSAAGSLRGGGPHCASGGAERAGACGTYCSEAGAELAHFGGASGGGPAPRWTTRDGTPVETLWQAWDDIAMSSQPASLPVPPSSSGPSSE